MLKDLTPAQLELARYMSQLSEEAYRAGWMDGLEFALWEIMRGERTDYGGLPVSAEHSSRLQALSDACGGWIVIDDLTDETWIARAEWEQRFSESNEKR